MTKKTIKKGNEEMRQNSKKKHDTYEKMLQNGEKKKSKIGNQIKFKKCIKNSDRKR